MKIFLFLELIGALFFTNVSAQPVKVYTSDTAYLSSLCASFMAEWPKNKTINLVFHGHSVPSGYFKTPQINTLQSYPELTLKYLSEKYPTAVINSIKTCIGGENAAQGAARFDSTVLNHKPDILFIDYALNDRGLGLQKAKAAWQSMIEKALLLKIKVVLFTPTPDQSENIKDTTTALYQHSQQIIELAALYHIAVVDSYNAFRLLAMKGEAISDYMSQVNHPNVKGHQVVLAEIQKLFSSIVQ